MKKHLLTACLYTVVTAVLLGVIYPVVITGIAQLLFHEKANGQLISQDNQLIGSRIIGQAFSGPRYFHSRPSAAGSGYDATASGGSNLAPTNKALIDRVATSVKEENQKNIPIDLVTASGSGLDPDISPAAALYQVPRIAVQRHLEETTVRTLITEQTIQRQVGLFGEPRVNVLQINLALDALSNRFHGPAQHARE